MGKTPFFPYRGSRFITAVQDLCNTWSHTPKRWSECLFSFSNEYEMLSVEEFLYNILVYVRKNNWKSAAKPVTGDS